MNWKAFCLRMAFYPILRMPGGGEWRPEILKRHKHLFGTRVKVTGTRDGFELLAIDRIELA
jgi:hypothetical protein